MADDHYSRPPRPSNPLARAQPSRRAPLSGGDPLAELARLIGQSDPYADYAQTPPSAGSAGAQPHDMHDGSNWRGAADPYAARHDPYAQQPDYQDDYGAGAPYNPPSSYQDQPYPPHAPAHGYSDPGYGDQNYSDQNYSEPYYGDQNYADGAAHQDQRYAPEGYAPQSYADPQYSERVHDARYGDAQQDVPQFASPQYDDKPYPAYDNQLYANQAPAFPPVPGDPHAAHRPSVPYGQGYPGAHYNDPNTPAYGAPYYHEPAPEAEEAPARRRGGLVTVLAVLALAVVGTAAAFGYRAIFSPAGTSGPPPVIKADTAPSKIVPANDAAKPIQDRVGDRAQIERIINREEQPVDVNAARAGAPRVVFPGPNPIAPLPNSPIPQSPASQASAPTGSAAVSTEPKKIRTVTIRSDQPELAAAANATAAATSAPRANVPSGVLPDDDQHSTARAQATAPASHAPLSLSPGTVQSAQRAAPTRTASAPATNGGGYSVQVTSQRSEGEAQAAYAALQAKFPGVLGNRQALIRRADLGERGIYYRAQIPFGSQGEAADFCTSLRSAGGQCVIQRN